MLLTRYGVDLLFDNHDAATADAEEALQVANSIDDDQLRDGAAAYLDATQKTGAVGPSLNFGPQTA